MASNKALTVRTGLDALPDPSAVPAKLYDLFVTIYNAIDGLAANISSNFGLDDRLPEDYNSVIGEDKRVTHRYDTLSAIKFIAGVPLAYGDAVYIYSDGKVYLSPVGTYLNGYWSCPMIGFVTTPADAEEECSVMIRGILGSTNAEVGDMLGRIGNAGYDGRIGTFTSIGVSATGALYPAWHASCVIGVTVSSRAILTEAVLS